ncbi:MAG: TolC family protein [Terriglobia bacterium]|jgi:outer membrane protein TolC
MKRTVSFLIATFFYLTTPVWVFSQAAPGRDGEAGPPLSLAKLVQEATERNPEILAARRIVEAKRARIPQAGAWPDPTVSLSYGGNALPPFTVMRADPSSNRQVMAEQMIPYPGKTRLRTQIATRDADAETLAYDAVERRVAAAVKQAYFDLAYVDRSLAILQKDREALEGFEKVTEIRYSVGKAAQQDVLRAQLEVTRLSQRATMLNQQRRTLEAQLNSLRNVPIDSPVGPPMAVQPSAFAYTQDQLQDAAQANYPVLKQRRTMVDQNRLSVDLARKERRPDFSVGYAYMQRDGMPDMYGITLSTSLPLFHHRKQDMVIAEAAANLESARQMQANELTVLRYQVQQDFLEVQATEQLLKLYSQGIAPQSSLTLESSINSYETGGVDFLNVISNFQAVIDAELDYHMQATNHEKALARLEEVTGLNLIQQGDIHHE